MNDVYLGVATKVDISAAKVDISVRPEPVEGSSAKTLRRAQGERWITVKGGSGRTWIGVEEVRFS